MPYINKDYSINEYGFFKLGFELNQPVSIDALLSMIVKIKESCLLQENSISRIEVITIAPENPDPDC